MHEKMSAKRESAHVSRVAGTQSIPLRSYIYVDTCGIIRVQRGNVENCISGWVHPIKCDVKHVNLIMENGRRKAESRVEFQQYYDIISSSGMNFLCACGPEKYINQSVLQASVFVKTYNRADLLVKIRWLLHAMFRSKSCLRNGRCSLEKN